MILTMRVTVRTANTYCLPRVTHCLNVFTPTNLLVTRPDTCEEAIISHILQVKEIRPREAKQLVQGCTASKGGAGI
jgi:hypothetical protein